MIRLKNRLIKKILTISLSLILLYLILFCAIYSCSSPKISDKNKTSDFDCNINLDYDNIFFDDFTNGINPEKWTLGNSQWGKGNGGVIPQNVHYTHDGVVVLQSNGDLYTGKLKGHGNDHGRRTGATIITRDYLGPGRFEVRMKILPRFGSTTAFWTFYCDDNCNHEIDIELNVDNDFTSVWNTNWHELTLSDHYATHSPIVNNDGEWHIYKFEWHTSPERIDYYIDDILTHTSYEYVPSHAGTLSIGNWFPVAWAGIPDFEKDYTLIDWFKYTPYKDNDYISHPKAPAMDKALFPQEPIDMPTANLIANASFENNLPIPVNSWQIGKNAWRTPKKTEHDIEFVNNKDDSSLALKLINQQSVYQYITGMHEGFELKFTAQAKGKGTISIDFMPATNEIINTVSIDFNNNKWEEKSIVFTLPINTKRLKVRLLSKENNEILFDDLFCNMTKKLISD